MKQTQTQKIVLDTCLVIDLVEKPKFAFKFKDNLKGKSIKVVLCDVVLHELRKVKRWSANTVIRQITEILGRQVELSQISEQDKKTAKDISDKFRICHNGDNKILSLCKARDFILVTFDGMLLTTCGIVGVAGFHPSNVRGI